MNIFSQYTIKIKKLVNNLKNKGKIDLPSNLDSVIVDIPPKFFRRYFLQCCHDYI